MHRSHQMLNQMTDMYTYSDRSTAMALPSTTWALLLLMAACLLSAGYAARTCAQGLCGGGRGPINRDHVICDNSKAGSPCGSDQPATLVLKCGQIHDEIIAGARTPCEKAANDYFNAHPGCCGENAGSTSPSHPASARVRRHAHKYTHAHMYKQTLSSSLSKETRPLL